MYKKIILGVIVVGVLWFAYYAISPLFNNIEINDALPESIKEITQDVRVKDEAVGSIETTNVVSDTEETVVTEDIAEVAEVNEVRFPIVGTVGHPADGFVRVLETIEGVVVRYEDFSTINGPRLHVYLSKDMEANEFVDLGPIKGTSGNINYTVPNGINIDEYKYVMYWCVPFSALFNYAEIN